MKTLINQAKLNNLVAGVDDMLVNIMKEQKDKGMDSKFPSERSVACIATLMGRLVEKLVEPCGEVDAVEKDVSKLVTFVLAKGLPNYVAQTSTMQKRAVKAGIYAAPKGEGTAKAEEQAVNLMEELDKLG